jgi:hypothetical protein
MDDEFQVNQTKELAVLALHKANMAMILSGMAFVLALLGLVLSEVKWIDKLIGK